jgi:hypothetical protein
MIAIVEGCKFHQRAGISDLDSVKVKICRLIKNRSNSGLSGSWITHALVASANIGSGTRVDANELSCHCNLITVDSVKCIMVTNSINMNLVVTDLGAIEEYIELLFWNAFH